MTMKKKTTVKKRDGSPWRSDAKIPVRDEFTKIQDLRAFRFSTPKRDMPALPF